MAEPLKAFDPSALPLRAMRGGDYMDVKHRLVWLREVHPDAHILTEEKAHDPGKWATFRASVVVPNGGSATGHGSETAGDFGDYYEKAETKALGRALAALGFGAQFLPEDGEALADSPVDRSRGQGATNRQQTNVVPRETVDTSTGEIIPNRGPDATEKQLNWILGLGKGRGYVVVGDDGLEHTHEEQTTAAINREFGTTYTSVRHISRADASRVIDKWAPPKEDRPQQQATPTPIRQTPVSDLVTDETAWTEFWRWARTEGVNGAPKFTELTQRSIQGLTPPEARDVLTKALASMPKQSGTAGNDRFTS